MDVGWLLGIQEGCDDGCEDGIAEGKLVGCEEG